MNTHAPRHEVTSHSTDSIFRLCPDRPVILGLLLASLATSAVGQVSLTTMGTPSTQSFDTLATSGSANAWSDNATLLGWYSQFELGAGSPPTTYRAEAGVGNAGALYSYGTGTSEERALGSVSSGTPGTIYFAVQLANNTGFTIDSLAINFTGEQWRNGGNASAQTLSFEYQVVNAGTITDANLPSTGWTAATSLDFVSPVATVTASALDGNDAANRTAKSATLTVEVKAGQEIWLRWKDINDGGADHGLAIDDLSVTPTASLQSMVNSAQPGGEVVIPPGEYAGIVVNQPLTLRAATPGTVTINGASPALTVNSVVSVSGLTFATTTADPTILVNSGGALTMRNCVVHESTSASAQPAVRIAAALVNPGTADLGTVGSPGGNTINIRGAGSLVRNETANNISAIGNTWQQDGVAITSNFTIEDNIYHALDGSGLGLTTWVDGNVYVTQNSGSLQRGIDAVVSGGRVNIQAGAYIDDPDATAKAVVLVPGSSPGQVIIMGDLTLSSDDTLEMELNGTTAGTTYDQLVVDGFVDLGSASLSVTTDGYAFAECDQLTLIENDDTDAVTGTFAGLPAGTAVTVGAHTFRIRYDRGTGNDVVLVKDGTAPIVACLNPTVHILSGNPSVSVGAVDVFNAAGSSDNCGGPVSFVSVSPSTFVCAGVYSVTVTGTDVNDNLGTCTATVTVINDNPAPAVVYVDDGYVGLPNGTSVDFPYTGAGSHTIGCDAFASVQAGINAVAANGTVNVAAGTYAEAVNANKSLTLLGANAGTSGNAPRGAESLVNGGAGIAIDVTASGVTVDGFQLSGVTGLRAQLQSGTTVRNNVIQGGALGINVVGAVTPLEIRDNAVTVSAQEISGTPTVGINLSGVSGGAAATVQNNNITGPLYGYVLYAVGTIPTTAVVGGTIIGVMQGVAVVNTIDGVNYAASTANVLGTVMTGFTGTSVVPARNFHAGVYVFTGGADNTKSITSSISVNVSGTGKPQQDSAGLYFADFSTGAGVRQNIQVESASIINNLNRGVYARGANAVVSIDQSYITGNGFDPFGTGGNDGFGIISRAGATVTVTESYIHNPSTVTAPYFVHAIAVDAGNLTVTGCSIENSGNSNGKLTTASGSINASGNWWGNNALATIQAGLTGTVDFTPWLDNGADTSVNPAFQGDFSTLHVDDASPQVGSVEYIQEGVDMVSGSTVLLGPGSYSANVTIIGHVNILGSGSGNNPLVDSIVTAANVALPVIAINNAGGASAANRLAIKNLRLLNGTEGLVVNATSGSHRFYDFDNLVSLNHPHSGIRFTGTASLGDALVSNSTASNNGLYGVFVDSTLLSFDTLLVTGCSFADNGQNGLSANGDHSNPTSPSGVQVVSSTFASNGAPLDGGSGDISFFLYNGDGGLKDVTITSDARHPIQIRGKNPGTLAPCGIVGLTNVTVTGTGTRPALYIQQYADVNNVTLDTVDLSAYVPTGFLTQMAVEHFGATPMNLGKLKLKTTYLGGPPSGYVALSMFASGGAVASCDTVIVNAVDTQDLEDAVFDAQDAAVGDVVFPAFNIACAAVAPAPAECAGGGAIVTFATPVATADCLPLSVATACTPPSGSTFLLGNTLVTCSATDARGIVGSCTFTVTVVDTIAPSIVCSPNLDVCSPTGTPVPVSFTVTATDGCDSTPTIVCTPASGSPFPIGTTTVNCTATDDSLNSTPCSFTVTVHDTSVVPAVVYVDDGYIGLANCTPVNWPYTGTGSLIIGYNAFATIQGGVDGVASAGTVNVAAGTYGEDVSVNNTVSLLGAGAGSSIVEGPMGGAGSTFTLAANNIILDGFAITRAGNNLTDWFSPALNSAGVSISTSGAGATVRNCRFYGNRTGIDINNVSGITVRNNVISDNRTGMIMRNVTDNLTVVENEIADNWTMGILFLDASGGTGSPPQTAANCTFKNNDLSGNWYGQIVDRQTGGALPAPGANLKNFSGNWLGTTTPVVTSANSAEAGYATSPIPVAYGGTGTPPGGQPDIAGPASANIDFTPWLHVGTDTDVSTGFGTYGFQGDFSTLHVDDASPQVGSVEYIQEGVDMVSGSTVLLGPGSYSANVTIIGHVNILGSGSGNNPVVDSIVTAANVALPVIAINNAGGASAANRLAIKNLRLLNGTEGLVVNATSGSHRFYDFDNLVSLNHPHSGIRFTGTASLGDALVSNSTASNNGLYGVFVDSTLLSFDTLLVTGCTFADNDQAGVAVNGLDGNAASPTGVQVVSSVFTSNGQVGNGGSGDVSFFLFNGDAGLKDVTIAADSRHPIQFRGKHTGGVLPAGLAAAGVVGLTNVTVTGTGNRPALYLHRYLSVNNVNLDNVDLSAYLPPLLPAGFAAQMMVEHYSATPMNLGKLKFKTTYLGGPVAGFHQALAMAGSGGAVASCDTVMVNAVNTEDLEDGVLDNQDASALGDVVFPAFNIACLASTPPDAQCAGPGGTPVSYTLPSATVDCGPLLSAVTCLPVSGHPFGVGVTPVVCTATDARGISTTCSFNVTVVDTIAPTISCPPNVTVFTGPGNLMCNQVATWAPPTASDTCATMLTVTCSHNSGDTFPVGTTTVSCSANDGFNATSCSFTVTVIDTTPPVITGCPGPVVAVTTGPGSTSCDQVATWVAPTALDNCAGPVLVTCVPASGTTFAVGSTLVTCTATDGVNSSTCSFTVSVTDDTVPTIACPLNISVDADDFVACGKVVTFAPATTDNCPGEIAVCSPPSGSLFPLGVTTVNCYAQDAAGNQSAGAPATCSFTVTVRDYSGDASVACWRGRPNATYQHWIFSTPASSGVAPERTDNLGGPTASISFVPPGTGWVDQDPLGFGCFQGAWDLGPGGAITLTIPNVAPSPTDQYKYVRVQVTQFRFAPIYNLATVDVPGATIVGAPSVTVLRNNQGSLFGEWVVETSLWRFPNCPATETVTITGPVVPFPGFQFASVVDQVVVDTLCQDFACPAPVGPLTADAGQCSRAGVTWTVPVDDDCEVLDVVCTADLGMGPVTVFPTGTTFPVGVTTVNCVVTDSANQPFTCTFTVTVTDDEDPIIACPAPVLVQCASLVPLPAADFAGFVLQGGTATDNCGPVTVVHLGDVTTPGGCPNQFTVTRTYEAMDLHGNTATCTQIITVNDNTPPVLTLGTIASCYLTASAAEAAAISATTASDNCSGLVNLTAATAGTCNAVITVTGTDTCGNTASVIYNTRIDNAAPVIASTAAVQTQPNVGTVSVHGCANLTVQGTVLITVVASDNCGLTGVPTLQLVNGGTVTLAGVEGPPGTYTYNWLVDCTTANGTWTATVTAADGCQTDVETFTLCVNTTQIAGLVELQGFLGTCPAALPRTVTFKATDGGGLVLQTWTLPVVNAAAGTFPYTLTGIPAGTVNLSAKTDWTLRRRLPVGAFVGCAAGVNFTGASGWLKGGDIIQTPLATANIVNLPDYSSLAANFGKCYGGCGTCVVQTPGSVVADINGDGVVNLFDYNLLASNWFTAGDPE